MQTAFWRNHGPCVFLFSLFLSLSLSLSLSVHRTQLKTDFEVEPTFRCVTV